MMYITIYNTIILNFSSKINKVSVSLCVNSFRFNALRAKSTKSFIILTLVRFCGVKHLRVSTKIDKEFAFRFSGIKSRSMLLLLLRDNKIELIVRISQLGEVLNLPPPEISIFSECTEFKHVIIPDSNFV